MVNKKARQRISYVLPLNNSSGGHRLGVNGLALDNDHSILYSGGRDGAICAWKLNNDLNAATKANNKSLTRTTFHAQTEAHTHWVNDIVLADNNAALVSASSDLTVKVWRPLSNNTEAPQTIGQHTDYVKCLATPKSQAEWVASGGLDRRVCLWDLNGAGQKLEIEARDEEKSDKGSVYALATNRTILASGGPDSVVRLWDPRSGIRITKFVGHTDNIRDILIAEAGDAIMTASSDQTIKLWSVTACRCLYTLTMHNDSVWSLYSDDPSLCTFYSSDRSGLVVKTEVSGSLGLIHNGLALAIAQENEGVNKVIACKDFIWTATSSSSINRWANVDVLDDFQLPEPYRRCHPSKFATSSCATNAGHLKQKISAQSILRISDTSNHPVAAQDSNSLSLLPLSGAQKALFGVDHDVDLIVPIRTLSEETIEGQHGLVKHKLLNDRRRVLTLDTAGDILLWDLLQCIPIRSFGKRHLEDVEPEVNTTEAVAPWCSLNTRTGRLAVDLEEYNCFDAEMYADELQLDEAINFREDQRINLGKWILRYLFSNFVDEMVKKDEEFRRETTHSIAATEGLSPIINPISSLEIENVITSNGIADAPTAQPNHISWITKDEVVLSNRNPQTSVDCGDSFYTLNHTAETNVKTVTTLGEIRGRENPSIILNELEKETSKEGGSSFFGKNFRKGIPFGSKKNRSVPEPEKPTIVDEKIEDGSEISDNGDKEQDSDDCFAGVVRKIRMQYMKDLQGKPPHQLESGITPSPPNETPLLKPPPLTSVIIQEETSGGNVDLYRGTVATVGEDARFIEERAPTWLGDLLLLNHIPDKITVKVSFILQPWRELLPNVAGSDGNSRLNANRMLRVKKILAYVAEHLELSYENSDPNALRPEEYLELYCNDQKLPITMTLATLRAHVWKSGADVMLYYKSNGRRSIPGEKIPEPLPNE